MGIKSKITKRRKSVKKPILGIKESMQIVDKAINKIMVEFINLGYKSKELQKEVDAVHRKMAKLFITLKPCENRVRNLYPQLNELFDGLTADFSEPPVKEVKDV